MTARPDRREAYDEAADLDLRSMPSFLSHPPAANDAAGRRSPLLRRRRSLALPLTAGLGAVMALAAGVAYVLVGGSAVDVAKADATRTAAIVRTEPAPPPPPVVAPAPAGIDRLRETITASAGPVPVPEPRPAPEPAIAEVKEVARLEAAPPPPAPVVEAPPAPAPLPAPVPPRAAPAAPTADAERALRRAETLLEQGDISAARLFLERAAEGGSGRALFRLAETYDPRALQRWGARGIRGSADKARELYRKAQAAGETEAGARLAGLR